jgi:hypothetical protein
VIKAIFMAIAQLVELRKH